MLSDTYTPIRSNPDSIVSTPLWPTSLTSQILQASGWIKLSLDGMKQCSHARQDTRYKQSRITLNITHMWEYTPHSVWLNKISSSYQNNSNIQSSHNFTNRFWIKTKSIFLFPWHASHWCSFSVPFYVLTSTKRHIWSHMVWGQYCYSVQVNMVNNKKEPIV